MLEIICHWVEVRQRKRELYKRNARAPQAKKFYFMGEWKI